MEKCLGCKEDTSSGIRSCVNDNIIPLCKKCHKNTFDRFGSENIGGIFDTIAKWIEPFGSISIDPSSMEQNEALLVLSLLNAGENLIEEGKDPKDFALSLFTDTVDLDKNWANLHLMSIKLRHKTPDLIATYAVIVPYHTNIIESYWLSINKINSDFLYNHELNKALYKI